MSRFVLRSLMVVVLAFAVTSSCDAQVVGNWTAKIRVMDYGLYFSPPIPVRVKMMARHFFTGQSITVATAQVYLNGDGTHTHTFNNVPIPAYHDWMIRVDDIDDGADISEMVWLGVVSHTARYSAIIPPARRTATVTMPNWILSEEDW